MTSPFAFSSSLSPVKPTQFLFSVVSKSTPFSALFSNVVTPEEGNTFIIHSWSPKKNQAGAHEDEIVVTSLSLELIKQLVEAAKEGDIGKLKEIIRDGFSDSYVLNNSFLKKLELTDDEDISVVDLEAAAEAYRLIIALERAPILHTLENATELVVSRLALRKQSIACPKDLRQVMILLENPLVLHGESYGGISPLRKLAQTIVGLPPHLQRTLTRWFTLYSEKKFAELIDILHSFINAHMHQQHTRVHDSVLHHGITLLRFLYEANQSTGRVSYTSFYNDAVCEKVNIKDDYRKWMQLRHADVLEERKKDLFNDIESAPSRPAEGSTPEGRKEMVADDEAVDERAPEYATWVSEDSQSDSSPAETRATTDAFRNHAMPDEEHGRRVELHVDEVQSNEERGSKARVRSFAEEEALSNTSHQRRAAREEKGKEKVGEDQSEYEREKNENESESEEGNERRRDEQPSDHESDAAVTEGEEAEETDQEAKRRRKRKEKRRARSFLDNTDAQLTKTEFFFCDYPFLLDPTTKARIMHIDAAMQMSYEVEDAIAKLSFLGMLKEQSLPLFIPASIQRTAVPHLILEIRRQELIADTLAQVSAKLRDLKKPLKVKFVGEEGIDQGGVQKEFFQLIVEEIFDPKFGMFSYDEETRRVWFNPFSLETEKQYQLIGMILGLAIYNGVILDLHLPVVVYKKLLGHTPTFADLKELRPMLAKGIQQLLDYDGDDVEDVFCLTFQTEHDMFGERVVYDLKPGGEDIPVTNANRKEYVDLYVKYLLEDSIAPQFKAFALGFETVCGGPVLQLFRGEELEQLICGSADLDFNELEKIAVYLDGYHPQHPTIRAFWEVVHELSVEQKKYLLAFVTGSDRVPIKGISKLTFIIQRNGPDTDRLPTSFTCFSRLLLPEYASKEKLEKMLTTAIDNARGFGLC